MSAKDADVLAFIVFNRFKESCRLRMPVDLPITIDSNTGPGILLYIKERTLSSPLLCHLHQPI